MSRQFRSLLSPPPTSPPALNNVLKVLVIADPAPACCELRGARREGLAWRGDPRQRALRRLGWPLRIKVNVRIGPASDGQVKPDLESLRAKRRRESAGGAFRSSSPCSSDASSTTSFTSRDTDWPIRRGSDRLGVRFRLRALGQGYFSGAPGAASRVRQCGALGGHQDCNEMRKHMTGLAQAFSRAAFRTSSAPAGRWTTAAPRNARVGSMLGLVGLRFPMTMECTSRRQASATR